MDRPGLHDLRHWLGCGDLVAALMTMDRHTALSKAALMTDSTLMRLKLAELVEIYLHVTNQHGKDPVGYPGTKLQIVIEIMGHRDTILRELSLARRHAQNAQIEIDARREDEDRAARAAEWEAMRKQQAAEVNAFFATFPPLEPL